MNPHKRYSKMDQYRASEWERKTSIAAMGLVLWVGISFIIWMIAILPW